MGKLDEKIRAQELRRTGLSYRQIILQIHVSKDTVSRWCKDIKLTKIQEKKLLENKMYGQRKGSIVAANNKRNARILKTKQIFKDAKLQLGKTGKRDRFITGIALYAGEGNKKGNGGFTNSDPILIKFMTRWFQEFCGVPKSRLRGSIWIHNNLDEKKARVFWSKLTKIPLNQFTKTYVVENKINSKKIRKNIHLFGVFSVRFSDSDKQRRIIGWISALMGGKIPSVH